MPNAELTLPPTNIAQAKACLRDIWTGHTETPLVPMLWGEAGIGKSSLVTQVAREELNFERVVKLITSKLRPEDLTGVPFPYEPGYSRFHPPLWLFLLTKRGQEWAADQHVKQVRSGAASGDYQPIGDTVLFLDELTLAPQDIQAPLLSLIEDRTLGAEELELDDHVRIVAAGNRQSHGAFARPLSTPMKTRLAPHLEIVPTFKEWLAYAREMGVYPPILAYLQQHPAMLRGQSESDASPPAPTPPAAATEAKPRTWFKASVLCQRIHDIDLLAVALEGTIGPGPAHEFVAYLRSGRHAPTVDQIAANPLGTKTFDHEPDIAYLVLENIYDAMRRDPERYMMPLLQYIGCMHNGYRAKMAHQILGIAKRQDEKFLETVLNSGAYDILADAGVAADRVETEGDRAMVAAPPAAPQRGRQRR